jgi:hypothetical protein
LPRHRRKAADIRLLAICLAPPHEIQIAYACKTSKLRRYGDRFTIFCQTGQTRLPPPKYPPLVTFLEPCVYDVEAPDADGVFHPKVWALRFIADDDAVRYCVLCLSRNLTFDRCWDTVVALDGELTDRSNAIAANHTLAVFITALPGLARLPVPPERRQGVAKIADELRRVRFTWPEGFDENQCRFWVGGLDGRTVAPFSELQGKALIVSPFVTNSVVCDFLDHTAETHLISRQESLQELPRESLKRCESLLSEVYNSHLDQCRRRDPQSNRDGARRRNVLARRPCKKAVPRGIRLAIVAYQ